MAKLIEPHGGKGLTICLLEGAELEAEKTKAAGLKKITISPRVKGDLIMLGNGGFSPLTGFMTKADWKGVCESFLTADGTFWPVPVTLDVSSDDAAGIADGDEIADPLPAYATEVTHDRQRADFGSRAHVIEAGLHGVERCGPADLVIAQRIREVAGQRVAQCLQNRQELVVDVTHARRHPEGHFRWKANQDNDVPGHCRVEDVETQPAVEVLGDDDAEESAGRRHPPWRQRR